MLDHPDIRMKRPGNVSINRALNCTRDMAEKYLDNLAAELISINLMKDAEQIAPGHWNGNLDLSRYV